MPDTKPHSFWFWLCLDSSLVCTCRLQYLVWVFDKWIQVPLPSVADLTASACILTHSTCWVICQAPPTFSFLKRVSIPSHLLSPFQLLCLCGFLSFGICFVFLLDYFNGRSSGIRKKDTHGLSSVSRCKFQSLARGWWQKWQLSLQMLRRPGKRYLNVGWGALYEQGVERWESHCICSPFLWTQLWCKWEVRETVLFNPCPSGFLNGL